MNTVTDDEIIKGLGTLQELLKKERADATREFALEITSRIHKLTDYLCDQGYGAYSRGYLVDDVHATIDNLVKEMTTNNKNT